MEMKRPPRHVGLPPPCYHPDSTSVILSIYYGGHPVHLPEAKYVGGSVLKLDYVNAHDCSIKSLDMWCDSEGMPKERRYYIIVNQGFKLLIDRNDLKEEHKRSFVHGDREVNIYVESISGGVEGMRVVQGLRVVQGMRVLRGEGGAGDEGVEGNEGGAGDELVDSDYEMGEGNNNEKMTTENDVRTGGENVGDESGSTSEDEKIDVVDNEGDLDEHRDSDGNDGDGGTVAVFNPEDTYDPTFELGMRFSNKSEFKKALLSHAIKSKRTLKFIKNDKIRVYAKCGNEDCEWKIHKFKSDPKRSMKGFRVDIINELRVNVSKDQAYKAKRAALKEIEESPDYQYTRLWDYAEEVRATNPGSTVILGTEEADDGEHRFSRMYVCFGGLKSGFKAGCRPIIGVDGCHLKGPNGGILLTAIGVDPNNSLFPIAYAVVNKECRETWEGFLIILKHDLNIIRQHEFTFMSDKQKGLMQAFEEVFPAKACTVIEFKKAMQEMKGISQAAVDWFNDKPPT
ncbi:UNVERIFIED_CONTAM: hypothetical protein Slati_1314200 [Sesamum latifolium]|uniref:Transposase MuDR plant domain-containing protein n=1 Tax=Sesamum latifolium TaxID=2727402 RepID=A0AAW2XKI7_9LAMI